MNLTKLEISNFRGIKNGELFFSDHSVLMGQNNSGKSTVIDAISLLLGRDRLVRNIGDYDFFGGTPQPEDRIFIKGTITGFPKDDPEFYSEWFNEIDGGIPAWYKPKDRTIQYGERPDESILAIEIGFCARFDVESLEYDTLRYFITTCSDPFEESSLNLVRSSKHLHELGFFLLPSKRTWDKTISFGSELFNRVIKFQDAIPGETVINLRDNLRSTEDRIEQEEPFKTIIERLNKELQGFTGFRDTSISFLPTTGDIYGVLQNLTPFIQGQQQTNIPVGKHGSGLISLQTLLLLLEFGRFRNELGKNFFLATEEPELHLQPGIHRRLVSRIRGLSDQSITTTHSPNIASYYSPREIIILQNSDGVLTAKQLLEDSEIIPDTNPLLRLYTIHRTDVCEALMHNKVIVPEGLVDYRWLKLLIGACVTAEGWEVYNHNMEKTSSFGVLPTQSASVTSTYNKFADLINDILPLVDGDASGITYIDDLIGSQSPPKIILHLGHDKTIEDVLDWIVQPQGTLQRIIELSTEEFDGRSFRDFLEENKTRWDYQESIVDIIVRNKTCFNRAQRFINSIHWIEDLPDNLEDLWSVDQEKSTDVITVLAFQYS